MRYDHIIVGTGQATATLLGKLIPTGESIAVIEADKVGGSCVNYGCTPTKTLIASARAIHLARQGSKYGFDAGDVTINFQRIRERMNEVRNGSKDGLTGWMESTENVTLIRGKAEFIGKRALRVGEQQIEGGNVYINVGTRPATPPIDGLETVPWLDSGRLLDLEEVPKHLLIVGGGYIGIEFAQVYRRFGSEVTIIQFGDQLMPREDADVAESIDYILKSEGIEILYNSKAKKTHQSGKLISLTIENEGAEQVLTGSHLLIATGRIPNSDTLNLDAAGIESNDRGFITVDDHCSTNVENIFALGDVNGHGAFTHTSVNDAEIVLDHLFGGDRALSKRNVVYALFTDPPLGRVGMSEKEALESGKKVLKAVKPMAQISRAKEMGETKGFAKLLVDGDTDLILGASILGVGGDEVINMFAAIMHSAIPCHEYRKVVLVHPTISELMPWVLDGIKEQRAYSKE